nr:MAG TPA: hypothetical protein [Bacteriophage sp.]
MSPSGVSDSRSFTSSSNISRFLSLFCIFHFRTMVLKYQLPELTIFCMKFLQPDTQ